MNFPSDDSEFQLNWTHHAGVITGLERAIIKINQQAARLYIADRNSEAEQLKTIARELSNELRPMKTELQEYIVEDSRRQNEIRVKQPGRPESHYRKVSRKIRESAQ